MILREPWTLSMIWLHIFSYIIIGFILFALYLSSLIPGSHTLCVKIEESAPLQIDDPYLSKQVESQ